MGWRCVERRLVYRLLFVLLFLFSRDWAYHASADALLGVCTPSEVSWAPSEVSFPPSEVAVVGFWKVEEIIPGVLDCVTR